MRNSLLVVGMAGTTVVAAWIGCSNGNSNASGSTSVGTGGTGGTTMSASSTSGGTGGTTTAGSTSGGTGGTTTASSSGATSASASSSGTTTASASSSGTTSTSASSSGSPTSLPCNPVTAAGCTDSGATCDLNGSGDNVMCYDGPNPTQLCQSCINDPCAPGSTCLMSGNLVVCARYCCTNADCGAGSCQPTYPGGPMSLFPFAPGLGVCLVAGPDGGGPDAGDNPFECTVPSTPPSGGSCVTVQQ